MSTQVYAVIRTGGKQYRVQAGDVIQIEKVEDKLGSEFQFQEVLMVGGTETTVGQPLVSGAKVIGIVTKQAMTRKKIVFKKRRRHSFRKLHNHKQPFTEVFVQSITTPQGETAKAAQQAQVVDIAQKRQERIAQLMVARKERAESYVGKGRHTIKADARLVPAQKALAKKAALKADKTTVKKVAKKAPAAKKSAKKVTKKD
ncbi:MAG: 50S ribosomal protein L21 [Pseudobdellovibrionaceae bacterium]